MTSDAVARLRRIDCCALSDALDRLKCGHVIAGVPQQSGEGRIAGRVVTLKLGVGERPPGPLRHLGVSAIESARADDVIVIEQRSGIDAGSWGGLLTLGALARGIAGVVADGPVRDIDEARERHFAIFARATTARTARGRIVELGCGVPIVFEGVTVAPGDYVAADRSAVVFIAARDIANVLDAAEAIVSKEAAMARAILAGTPIGEVMDGRYEQMLNQ